MKVTLQTKVLKDLVARVMKGVGNNDSIMRTCWIGITCDNNTLSMTAWDGENYLQVSEDKIPCEPFSVTVEANLFSQLINKTTSENITLELADKYLVVKGNGTCKLQLPVNEEGELDKYPNIDPTQMDSSLAIPIKLSSIVWAVQNGKIALAKTPELAYLMGYYFADNVYTTNNTLAARTGTNVFKQPLLLTSDLVNLVSNMEQEDITVKLKGNQILFTTPKTSILGYYNEGFENFEQLAPSLDDLFDESCPSCCSVKYADLYGTLDRIMLFVKAKEEGIRVMFTQEGIQFHNKEGSINETVAYVTSENYAPFEVKLQLDCFKDLISTISGSDENITIHYGTDGFLKFGTEKKLHLLTVLAEE